MLLPRLERERLIEVLIYHQRRDAQYCLCGWGELGRSHAEHIVEMFERDGVHARVNETVEKEVTHTHSLRACENWYTTEDGYGNLDSIQCKLPIGHPGACSAFGTTNVITKE